MHPAGAFIRATSDVLDDPETGQAIVERANEIQSDYDVAGEWHWDADKPENPGL